MAPLPKFKNKLSENLYGPVQSRRHGRSLGVNLGTFEKICTWSCLYCQYGFGRTIRPMENLLHSSAEVIFEQIKGFLSHSPELESITLAGNSEPGMYPEILALMKMLKRYQVSSQATWKLQILSNGSELHREDVVHAFNLADETWLKLDCGREEAFHRLNRPAPFRQGLVAHLERLSKVTPLYIQTMLWECPRNPSLSNRHPEDLDALIHCYQMLGPQKIHLYTIDRDPALSHLSKAPLEALNQFAARIRNHQIACEVFA